MLPAHLQRGDGHGVLRGGGAGVAQQPPEDACHAGVLARRHRDAPLCRCAAYSELEALFEKLAEIVHELLRNTRCMTKHRVSFHVASGWSTESWRDIAPRAKEQSQPMKTRAVLIQEFCGGRNSLAQILFTVEG